MQMRPKNNSPIMDWHGKKVFVTGAGGFIGSHLTERLIELGADVRALVKYNSMGSWGWLDSSPIKTHVDVVAGDIRDSEFIAREVKDREVVFHLAALIGIPYSYHAPRSYVETNIGGMLNVLTASQQADVELVVQTSTSEVYGSALSIPMSEEHPLQAQSPYSATKIGADKLAESFHSSFGFPVAILRPFNTYGPRQSSRAIIPSVITQALTGSEIRLGNLHPIRDFNFVLDTVDGFVRMAECPEAIGKVINLGCGKGISIEKLTKMIVQLVGKDVEILSEDERIRPDKSEVDHLCSDNSLAQAKLGWEPQYSLEDGLRITIEWITNNIAKYRPKEYSV